MLFFVGSYNQTGSPAPVPEGQGITSCSFDPQSGHIKIISTQFQRSPSYPIVAANGKILYAAEEMFARENPKLFCYEISKEGILSELNAVPIPADYACHLAIVDQKIITANYVSGDMHIYELKEDGRIGSLIQHIQHEGWGLNEERQEAPHPHMIYPIDNSSFFCVDLGIDQVKAYGVNQNTYENIPAQNFWVNPGAGARHMDMSADKERLVLVGELTAELFLYQKEGDCFKQLHSVRLTEAERSAGAIRLHPNNKFVYYSERKTNSIYVFLIDDHKLKFIESCFGEGITPRDISLDPTGKWLLVANQDSNTLGVFSICLETGGLKFCHTVAIPTPTCICWQSDA
jgi:6-phosphogluconolactonase